MATTPSPVRTTPPPITRPNRPEARRGVFLKWLRKTHGWIGLWGAVLGLLFGVTGFLQNHRAVLKLPSSPPVVESITLAVPPPVRNDAPAFAAWLQKELKFDRPVERLNKERAQPVAWGDLTLTQPEHWTLMYRTPNDLIQAEYWVNADQVAVKRRRGGLVNTIENMHRANGVGVAWVLLSDTIAGSLIFLSISGVLLWTELNKRKTVGAAIFLAALIALIVVATQTL